MSHTERLYYHDSHLTEFEARVVAVSPHTSGGAAVKLDRTAFYPTGGGQPTDTGTLDEARVVECIDEEEAGVLHVIAGASAPQVGSLVRGRVDWDRRQDHMQQHTGQHLLSQAFIELFKAETRGFRMMEQVSEIDVALDNPTDEKIERAVLLANRVVWEDRPISAREVSRDEAARLSLRKESEREGLLRLIEIEGFDLTPCGGTHAHRTGEVGMLAVRSWVRAKGMTRLEFVAGRRAFLDYRRVNSVAREVAAQFSVGLEEVSSSVARLFEENKSLQRRVRALEEVAARVEAEELLLDARQRVGNVRVVARVFEGREAESLKQLALALISHERTIALLGSRDKEAARLVFARSAETEGDMNSLMREACMHLEGRGGGRPDLAQGGGHATDKLEAVIAEAARKLGSH